MLIKYSILYYNKWKLNKLTSAKVNSVVYNFYYAGKLIRVIFVFPVTRGNDQWHYRHVRTGNLHTGVWTPLLLRSVRLLIIIFGLKNEISGLKVDWIRKVQINHLRIVLCSQVLKLITFLEKRNKNRYRRSININGNEDVIQSVTQATRKKNSSTPKRSRTYELL